MNTAVVLVWNSVNKPCVHTYIQTPVLLTAPCILCLYVITLLIDIIHHRVDIYVYNTFDQMCML